VSSSLIVQFNIYQRQSLNPIQNWIPGHPRQSLSASNLFVSIFSVVIRVSQSWKGGTELSVGVLLPNWKPKEVEAGKVENRRI